jgi:hypothetical protein
MKNVTDIHPHITAQAIERAVATAYPNAHLRRINLVDLVLARQAGATLAGAAARYGASRQAAHQIIRRVKRHLS